MADLNMKNVQIFETFFFSEFFFAMISQRYHLLIMIRGDHGG